MEESDLSILDSCVKTIKREGTQYLLIYTTKEDNGVHWGMGGRTEEDVDRIKKALEIVVKYFML